MFLELYSSGYKLFPDWKTALHGEEGRGGRRGGRRGGEGGEEGRGRREREREGCMTPHNEYIKCYTLLLSIMGEYNINKTGDKERYQCHTSCASFRFLLE